MIRSYLFGSVAFTAVLLSLASTLGACGSGNVPLGTQSSAQNGGKCHAAGGTCLSVGDDPCSVRAPSSADDCNTRLLPSGPFCCLVAVADAGPGACAPIPCPSGAPWNQAACACVAADAAAEACAPIPCPSGAPWNQAACACVAAGAADAAPEACAPLPCPSSEHWSQATCACVP